MGSGHEAVFGSIEMWNAHFELVKNVGIILFLIAYPILNFIMFRAVKKWTDAFITVAASGLVAIGVNAGVNLFFVPLMTEEIIPYEVLMFVIGVGTVVLWILGARIIAEYLKPAPKPLWIIAEENLSEEEMSPFDIRRKAYMARKADIKRY